MIQILALCLLSIPTSKAMNFIIFFRLLKDLCDQGYIIDFDIVRSKLDDLLGSSELLTLCSKVPVLNIFGSFYAGYVYQRQKGETILTLNMIGGLKEMTKEQKELYSKDPSISTAIMINYDSIKVEEEKVEEMVEDKKEDLVKETPVKNKPKTHVGLTEVKPKKVINKKEIETTLEDFNPEEILGTKNINNAQELFDKFNIEYDSETHTYINKNEDKPKTRSLNK